MKSNKLVIWIGVGLALLLIAYMGFKNASAKSPQDIFKENYKQDSPMLEDIYASIEKAPLGTRGAPGDTTKVEYNGVMMAQEKMEEIEKGRKDNLLTALNYFRQFKWVEARKYLNEYVETYESPVEDYGVALYYLGKSKLNQGDYAKATDIFNTFLAIDGQDPALMKAAQWDRALCYLNFNEDRAKTLLEDMAGDNNNVLQDDAKGLLAYFQ